jgi:hypothetical protein
MRRYRDAATHWSSRCAAAVTGSRRASSVSIATSSLSSQQTIPKMCSAQASAGRSPISGPGGPWTLVPTDGRSSLTGMPAFSRICLSPIPLSSRICGVLIALSIGVSVDKCMRRGAAHPAETMTSFLARTAYSPPEDKILTPVALSSSPLMSDVTSATRAETTTVKFLRCAWGR